MNSNVDWEDVRAVLAAAEEGSLSAAARRLGLSQPTMSRRVEALERALGATLFSRSTQGMTLTETGLDLLSHAEAMQAAAHRLELAASGRAEAAAGVVRVTAPRVMATHHLPRILADLAEAAPQVEVELVASDEAQNLLRREADIAIRMFQPTQPDLIARKVADLPLGLYASPTYLARRGRPTKETFRAHRMIGYDRNPIIIDWMASVGLSPPPGFFPLRTDDQVVYWRLVLAGAGLGANQRAIGDAAPEVERVMEDLPLPTLPVWLVTHAELRTSALIRLVYNALADGLGGLR